MTKKKIPDIKCENFACFQYDNKIDNGCRALITGKIENCKFRLNFIGLKNEISNTYKIILYSKHDLFYDGSAIIYLVSNTRDIKYVCSCLYDMLTGRQLYELIVGGNCIDVEKSQFEKYCDLAS